MKVSDLIAALKTYPGDSIVVLANYPATEKFDAEENRLDPACHLSIGSWHCFKHELKESHEEAGPSEIPVVIFHPETYL